MGRIIGIDLGLKRTGVAVTDPGQMIATPLTTVDTETLMEFLKNYTEKEDIDGFVLGDPVKPDGTPTHTTRTVQDLKTKLEHMYPDKIVAMVDERFTTSLAKDAMISGGTTKKYRRDKGNLDKISATIILQSYLDQKLLRKK